ncbi:MAG: energy transducer TonB [Bacteroidales bacterium]|nr:energy transducer TonB [Bacteroidales bacterium]
MKKVILPLIALMAALPLSAQTADGVPTTIRDFLKMSSADTTLCLVKGVVTNVRSISGGNFYIKDDTGELFIYGIVDPAHPGWGFRQMDIKQSDTVTLSGRRAVYKETIEMTSAHLIAKSDGPDHNAPVVFDREPQFKGKKGEAAKAAFSEWVTARLKYPKEANGAAGTVKVSFVVGKNGGVQEVQVIQGVNKALNDEAVRVVGSAPKWKPAILNGEPVRVTYTIPIVFIPKSN